MVEDQQPSDKSVIKVPELSLPKGGGAIKGIGETFKPDLFSGSVNYTIPIPIEKARGLEPELSLNYNSGNGNGPYGLGFELALPKFSIRTEKGIPQYNGNDVFLFNGEELVKKPGTKKNGNWNITEFQPRVQKEFSKIQYWLSIDQMESYWEVVDKQNVKSVFGSSQKSRIYNPENHSQIFEWLIDSSVDAKGNEVLYSYKADLFKEDPSEQFPSGRWVNNKYISTIVYGNFSLNPSSKDHAFKVVFDYGEYRLSKLTKGGFDPFIPKYQWHLRADAFSSFSSGFEVRTCRRCDNILLFNNFTDHIGKNTLIKQVKLTYIDHSKYEGIRVNSQSLLNTLKVTGYRRKGKKTTDAYDYQELPEMKFGFSSFKPVEAPEFKSLEVKGEMPGYLNQNGFLPVDLDSEGVSGFLWQERNTVQYYEPMGDGRFSLRHGPFDFPTDHNFRSGVSSFSDINGNGQLDLVVKDDFRAGFYKRNNDGSWSGFSPFDYYPTEISNPATENAGLSNNGRTDAILVEDDTLKVYPSIGEQGYGFPLTRPRQEYFPLLDASNPEQYVGFEDIVGDGLSHRVLVTNGSVAYWPDLGYGKFDGLRRMANAPFFETNFDKSRLFFADIDGTGTKDLVYVFEDHINLYINENGNSFSAPITIRLPEAYSDEDQISFMDLFGNGTTSIIFSKMGVSPVHYYYDFVGEVASSYDASVKMKPYLLTDIDNNKGMRTQFSYCSSIKFYLEDKQEGRPWITKLPFPVQVLEKVVTEDKVSETRFTSKFKFHDGYYDPVERKFQGFGYVESWDSEDYSNFVTNSGTDGLQAENFVPPVYQRTWHNTGAIFDYPDIMRYYESQFFDGDSKAYAFPNSKLEAPILGENSETIRQAYTALKGQVIRTEVYAEDKMLNPSLYRYPYSVTQSNEAVRLLQPMGNQPFAVFLVVPREKIVYHYERNPEDPRIEQQFDLVVDKFGNPLQSCQVYLGRRPSTDHMVHEEQKKIYALLTVKAFCTRKDTLFCHTICETREVELNGLKPKTGSYFAYDDLQLQLEAIRIPQKSNRPIDWGKVIPYGGQFSTGMEGRMNSWNRTFFWNLNQSAALDLGDISSRALVHHHETAFFSKTFTESKTFGTQLIDRQSYSHDNYFCSALYKQAGFFYDSSNEYWWNKGIVQYFYEANEPSKFFLPNKMENTFAKNTLDLIPILGKPCDRRQREALWSLTKIGYDDYALFTTNLIQCLEGNLENTTSAVMDYFVCKPKELIDVNSNCAQALFDPLGYVVVVSKFGFKKGAQQGGMTLYPENTAQYRPPKTPPTFDYLSKWQPKNTYLQGASSYFFYDFEPWSKSQTPTYSISLINNNFYAPAVLGTSDSYKIIIDYYDGFDRVVEKKMYVDPGLAYERDGLGQLTVDQDFCPLELPTKTRWQVTGRTVYNNKGKPFEQYLPYFINTPLYEDQKDILCPPPKVTHYDPLERVIQVDTPKGFYSKVVFNAWQEQHYDEDDTILDAPYYKANINKLPRPENEALVKASKFYNTPETKILDSKGHVFLDVKNNLGAVTKEKFDFVKGPSLKPAEVITELKNKKYIAQGPPHNLYWVTETFRPYDPGFKFSLDPKFKKFEGRIFDVLLQNNLVTYNATDIAGRVLEEIDARLYLSNCTVKPNPHNYNFRYGYPMSDKDPYYTDSVDAGLAKHLKNVYGKQCWSFSPRSYCQLIQYDRLQRKQKLWVKKIAQTKPIVHYGNFSLVEHFSYGETVKRAKDFNLRGQVYEIKDLSGVLVHGTYDINQKLLKTTRTMTANYDKAANWNKGVLLETKPYVTKYLYNAAGLLIAQTTPDKTITKNSYNRADQLAKVSVKFKGAAKPKPIVNDIEYNAKGQRLKIAFANTVTTKYSYEPTTLRLINIHSGRYNASSKSMQAIQDIQYYYDPVGNITETVDRSLEYVYNKNQVVKPELYYGYDALYRLVFAQGRQHKGINGSTHLNSHVPGHIKQSIFGPTPPINNPNELEKYTLRLSYDNSNNLIKKSHQAHSTGVAPWTREMFVESNSNRLQGMPYNASGDMLALDKHQPRNLYFNCCENLIRAEIIVRSGSIPNDTDFFNYDFNEQRTRKVTQNLINKGAQVQLNKKTYLGNYAVAQGYTKGTSGKATPKLTYDRQTLRIMDGETCLAILNYTVKDQNNPGLENKRGYRFQMDNNIGSVAMERNEKGKLLTYEEYFPYGGTAIITGKKEIEVKGKEYRFMGKERDDSTGLYYYGARYYLPWMGRWLKPDPAGTVDGLNLFAFVKGNPINLVDPDGLMLRRAGLTGVRTLFGSVPKRDHHIWVGTGTAELNIKEFNAKDNERNFLTKYEGFENKKPFRLRTPLVAMFSPPVDATALHTPETQAKLKAMREFTGTSLKSITWNFLRSPDEDPQADMELRNAFLESIVKAEGLEGVEIHMMTLAKHESEALRPENIEAAAEEIGLRVVAVKEGSEDGKPRMTYSTDEKKSVPLSSKKLRTLTIVKNQHQHRD